MSRIGHAWRTAGLAFLAFSLLAGCPHHENVILPAVCGSGGPDETCPSGYYCLLNACEEAGPGICVRNDADLAFSAATACGQPCTPPHVEGLDVSDGGVFAWSADMLHEEACAGACTNNGCDTFECSYATIGSCGQVFCVSTHAVVQMVCDGAGGCEPDPSSASACVHPK